MARKTIDVENVKGMANRALEASMRWSETESKYVPVDRYWRQGVMLMVEQVLMSTDNYKGFRYLSIDEVPTACTPGIRRDRGTDNQFDNTDNTRVRYF
jgi:hypothetical protein